jgi:hypothetical protein
MKPMRTSPASGSCKLRASSSISRLLDHAARPLHHPLADVCQPNLLAALHELDAELVLHFLELGAERRLADEAQLRRLAEMACLRQRHEVAERPEAEVEVDSFHLSKR